jgi:hypothetical protein
MIKKKSRLREIRSEGEDPHWNVVLSKNKKRRRRRRRRIAKVYIDV